MSQKPYGGLTMSIAERDVFSDQLNKVFENGGRGRACLVSGGVASGKTELLERLNDQAIKSGALVLSATASTVEQTLRMGVVGQLFRNSAVPEAVAAKAEYLLSAGMPTSRQPDQDPPAFDQTTLLLAQEICALVLEMAKERPVVITVDDAHFADQSSTDTLLHLQRRIRSARVLMVLAERTGEGSARLRTEVMRQPHSRHVRLQSLSATGVGELLAERLDGVPAESFVTACAELTGGNPMLVCALAEDWLAATATAGEAQTAPPVPVTGENYRQAVLSYCHRADPDAARVLRAVAVLDELATTANVAKVTDMYPSHVADLLSLVDGGGLTVDGRFRDPAARNAVLADLDRQEHTALYLRTAKLLHDEGAEAGEVAAYIAASGESGETWATTFLRDTAEQAVAQANLPAAVSYLDLARRTCADERQRAELTVRLAGVQWLVDPAAAGQHLSRLTADLRHGLLAREHAPPLARWLAWHGFADEAKEVLAGLRETIADAGPALAADYRMTVQWLRFFHPRLVEDTVDPTFADRGETAGSTLFTVLKNGTTSDSVHDAEQVLQGWRMSDMPIECALSALQTLLYAQCPNRATEWCKELLAEAENRNATTWRAILTDLRAAIALQLGNPSEARAHALKALEIMPPQGWGVAIGSPRAHLVLANTMMGKFDEAAEQLTHMMPRTTHQTRFWLQYLQARGHYHLATDRLHAALDDFQMAGDRAGRWGLDFPALTQWRSDAARVYVRLGRGDVAQRLVTEELELPGSRGPRIRAVALRVLASTDNLRKRVPLLQEAVDLLQHCGDPYELAYTLADLSQAGQVLGETNRARMFARRAIQLSKVAHANVLHSRLIVHSKPLPGSAEVADEFNPLEPLSTAERRVAVLAALGHSNQEISRKLCVTVSTVEQHLTKTYRKLKVSRRTDLPTELAGIA